MGIVRGILLTALCFLSAAAANAQTGRIRGNVLDSARQGPIGGASVMLLGTGKKVETNVYGEYRFSHVPTGWYTMKISYPDFDTLHVDSVRVIGGVSTLAPAFLRPPHIDPSQFPDHINIKINWTAESDQ